MVFSNCRFSWRWMLMELWHVVMNIILDGTFYFFCIQQWVIFVECSFSILFLLFFISVFAWFLQHVWTFSVLHTTVIGSASEGKQKVDDDEPSQLSLADRVRLFNQKIQDDSRTPVTEKLPPPTRKRLVQTSRFKTQPVTTEEVETAARRISPLAASLTKPPDPKVLGATLRFMQYLGLVMTCTLCVHLHEMVCV